MKWYQTIKPVTLAITQLILYEESVGRLVGRSVSQLVSKNSVKQS